MAAKLYTFEGEMMTIAEAGKLCPRISHSTLKRHIEAGRNTIIAVMSYDHLRASGSGARKAYAARGKPSMFRGSLSAGGSR